MIVWHCVLKVLFPLLLFLHVFLSLLFLPWWQLVLHKKSILIWCIIFELIYNKTNEDHDQLDNYLQNITSRFPPRLWAALVISGQYLEQWKFRLVNYSRYVHTKNIFKDTNFVLFVQFYECKSRHPKVVNPN